MSKKLFAALLLGFSSTVFIFSGCSADAKKAKLAKSADHYFASGDYDHAEIEYLNILRITPTDGPAIARLGLIYSAQGKTSRAVAYIMKGNELQPEDLEVRLRLGLLYQASGRFADAREQANYVLQREPGNKDAPILLSSAASTPEEVAAAQKQLLSLPDQFSKRGPVLVALAGLALKQNKANETLALLEKAKEVDPNFAPAYAALANYQIAQRNIPAARASLKEADRLGEARSPFHLQYAQFELRFGDLATGKNLLLEISKKTPDIVPVWLSLGEIALAQNNLAESEGYIEKGLARDPNNLPGMILRGRIHTARSEFDKAVQLFDRLSESHPKVPAVQIELGRALAANGDLNRATTVLAQVLLIAPDSTDATILLAQLNARKGDYPASITLLRKILERYPDFHRARFLLADAYRSQGDLVTALSLYEGLEKQSPQNPQTPLLRGLILAQQAKPDEAKKAFEKALQLAPDNPTALEQIINAEIREKQFTRALQRVETEITKNPKLAGFGQLLKAKLYLAQDNTADAETALNAAIKLMPDSSAAYFLLAGIYSRTNQQDKAMAQVDEILKRDPKQPTALMLSSVLQEKRGNYKAASEGYEKLIAIDPKSVVALNNLAYIYAERLNDLDRAQDLAQKARQLLPADAHAADTLGWIMYRKKQYTWALNLLAEAAEKQPENAEIQYHLGMASYMMGSEPAASAALKQALQLSSDASWVDAAKRALAILSIDPDNVGTEANSVLETALSENPDDPAALVRRSSLLEKQNKKPEAIALLETALKSNPRLLPALVRLARLSADKKDSTKALEYARAARKLAPDDAAVARTLGGLAFQNGDIPWAASLFQEAARKTPDNPGLNLELANAQYYLGRLDDARDAAKAALETKSLFTGIDDARQLLRLIEASASPEAAAKDAEWLTGIARAKPDYLPALYPSGLIAEQKGDIEAAQKNYREALALSNSFSPAKLRLAALGSTVTTANPSLYELSLQARQAYPAETLILKTIGIQAYLKGDFSRASSALGDFTAKNKDDALALYYQGLTQKQLRNAAYPATLERAISAGGLDSSSTTEAKRLVAEAKDAAKKE